MKSFVTALALFLAFGSGAEAKQGHILRGLFCNNRAQLQETLDHLARTKTMAIAVAMTNRDSVVCVHAYLIRYMVVRPVIIGHRQVNGQPLTLYQASLIGVLVGGNPRPVVPPVNMFFVAMDEVPDAAAEGGA